MSVKVDARGLSCPQPVVLTMQALASSPALCEVLVDNPTARENVTRYAENAGYKASYIEENEEFYLTLSK